MATEEPQVDSEALEHDALTADRLSDMDLDKKIVGLSGVQVFERELRKKQTVKKDKVSFKMVGGRWKEVHETYYETHGEDEKAGPKGKTVIFRTHHRAGLGITQNISKCIQWKMDRQKIGRAIVFSERLDGQLTDYSLARNGHPTVHVLRQPTDWIISWYKSIKGLKAEEWEQQSWATGWNSFKNTHGDDATLLLYLKNKGFPYQDGESIIHYLRRVPPDAGLAVAYREMTTDILPQVVEFSHACRSNPMCKQICLDSFTSSKEQYMDKWEQVFNFFGANIQDNQNMMSCIANTQYESTVSREEHEELSDIISMIDKEVTKYESGEVLSKATCKDSFVYGK